MPTKPQPLPDPLPTDIAEVKKLLDSRFADLETEKAEVQAGRENMDEYNRQIAILQKHSSRILGFDDYKPNIPEPLPKPIPEPTPIPKPIPKPPVK